MLNVQKIIKTSQVILRPLRRDDLESMQQLTQNEEVWTYFTSNLSVKEELAKWIETALHSMQKKDRIAFAIIERKNNSIIGSTSLGNFSQRDKRIEIGWTWLSEDTRGTGMNRHVKSVLLRYCFEELQMERVESKTDVLNIAARKGLAKSGFTEEGILRSHTLLANGRRRDSIYYSVLRNEWNSNGNVE